MHCSPQICCTHNIEFIYIYIQLSLIIKPINNTQTGTLVHGYNLVHVPMYYNVFVLLFCTRRTTGHLYGLLGFLAANTQWKWYER